MKYFFFFLMFAVSAAAASTESLFQSALMLYERGEYQKALVQFQKVLRQDPSRREAREYMLRCSVQAEAAPKPAAPAKSVVAEKAAEQVAPQTAGPRVTLRKTGLRSEVTYHLERLFHPGSDRLLPGAYQDLAWATAELAKNPRRGVAMKLAGTVSDENLNARRSSLLLAFLMPAILPAGAEPTPAEASWTPRPLLSGPQESR